MTTISSTARAATSDAARTEQSDARFADQARRFTLRDTLANKRFAIIGSVIGAGLLAWLVATLR
jgi:hypothetical protein